MIACDPKQLLAYQLQNQAMMENNTISMENLLIDHGTNDMVDETNLTILMKASCSGLSTIIELLLCHGANYDFANQSGLTALMCASRGGHLDVTKLLTFHGQDINRADVQGLTALMMAAINGQAEVMNVLIQSGAKVDMITFLGHTALMLACKRNHPRCVEVLVLNGAEICELSQMGRPARYFAQPNPSWISLLSPQLQVNAAQKHRNQLRQVMLLKLRQSALDNKLELTISSDRVQNSEWASALLRALGLPLGVFEAVLEYLPLPRVWKWSFTRLERRCVLNPHQAMLDISCAMDEILCDAKIFAGFDQKLMLVKINQSTQIQDCLLHKRGMSRSLLQSLCRLADTQLDLNSGETQQVDSTAAVCMLVVAKALHACYRQNESAAKHLSPIVRCEVEVLKTPLKVLKKTRTTSGVKSTCLKPRVCILGSYAKPTVASIRNRIINNVKCPAAVSTNPTRV